MQQQPLKINRELLTTLLDKLRKPDQSDSVLREIKRMLIIKQRIALEAEVGC